VPAKVLRSFVLLAFATFFFATSISAQSPKQAPAFRGAPVRSSLAAPSIEKKVEALLRQMTLEEKVGQLVQYSVGGPEISAKKLSAKTLNAELRRNSADAKPALAVTANVSNTGKTAAEEVVHLYVRLQGTSVKEPVRKLKGFQRVVLAPAEMKKVTFSLGADSFALCDIRND
jgi:hypothetical protein